MKAKINGKMGHSPKEVLHTTNAVIVEQLLGRPMKKEFHATNERIIKRPVGRPKKDVVSSTNETIMKRPVGRPKKYVLHPTNETLIKRPVGRPKKDVVSTTNEAILKKPVGRPKKQVPHTTNETLIKRPVGRPKKEVLHATNGTAIKRPVGRPKKTVLHTTNATLMKGLIGHQKNTIILNNISSIKRGRGRPKLENESKEKDRNLHSYIVNDHPRQIIPQLSKLMYDLGWATGTGGGISVKLNDTIYMAPSGVQKEMIKPIDIFELDCDGEVLKKPSSFLSLTQCAPLFMNAYTMRDAGAVLHSHGIYAVLATLIFKGSEFRISHDEMMKGIKKGTTNESYSYYETLVVPIVENVPYESDLKNRMRLAMELYPDTNAVLVRRHGVYIWGKTWQRAKAQAECYHYLFQLAVNMKQLGMEPDATPQNEHGIVDD